MNYWLILTCAIALEVAGTTSMKLSDGFSKLTPSILIFVFYAAAFVALTVALKKIDVSVAYAVWSGVGTALIAMIGIWFFDEALTMSRVICLMLIIAGVVGLFLTSASTETGSSHFS